MLRIITESFTAFLPNSARCASTKVLHQGGLARQGFEVAPFSKAGCSGSERTSHSAHPNSGFDEPSDKVLIQWAGVKCARLHGGTQHEARPYSSPPHMSDAEALCDRVAIINKGEISG